MSATLEQLLDALSQADAYPGNVGEVEVHQTHISVVFLVGDRAYKVKKPVDLGFVDYSTLERRRQLCRREVELNRRLAPSIYRGVVPIVSVDGALRVGGDPATADVVEWAVEMVRLDDAATLKSRLARGAVEPAWMDELGALVSKFHRDARRGPEVSAMASFDVVARNALDNFRQSVDQVGETIARPVFERYRARTEAQLEALRPVIEERARSHVPCDTHGDLRLEHVYRIDERLVIIDCIEFNDAFRFADPVADAAFLTMDLRFRWADELAGRFEDAYFDGADQGRALLPFYVAYRSAVRGKVHGIRAVEPEVPPEERAAARRESAAHWMFGWSTLAEPSERPALVGVFGLPGTGKSTLAGDLATAYGFEVIDSDVVRKELAGLSPDHSAADAPGAGIYTAEFSRKTYRACLDRALDRVREGGRVIVDATFRSQEWRVALMQAAKSTGVTGMMLECVLPREVAGARIDRRSGGPSDADWEVYRHMEQTWEPAATARARSVETVDRDDALAAAAKALADFGLVE